MTYSKPLADRERALEDAFFHKETERLLEAMRTKESRDSQLKALSKALGFDDPAIVEPLLDLGLRESNVSALIMAPLVAVAWADGILDNEEKKLIVKSEIALGIEPDSEGANLVEVWLSHRPHSSLIDAWASYVHELCGELSTAMSISLRDDILARARRIAHALEKSFLRASGPTHAETAVLETIERAFAGISED